MKYALLFLLNLSLTTTFGQLTIEDVKHDIAYYGDIVMNAAASEHRIRANDSLVTAIDRFLSFPKSFQQEVQDLPWISVQQDDDNTFRMLTWQLNVGDSSFVSYGRIQLESNDFVVLTEQKNILEPRYRELDANNWLGARYYNIKEFKHQGQSAFILFGYNGFSRYNRQKIADVLFFDDGIPKFGLPVFSEKGKDADRYGAYRLTLTYTLDSRVSLDFDEKLNMIVHDHLVAIQGRFAGQGETAIGDGSFEGYKLNDKGIWIYSEKLFNEKSDEPLDSGIDRSDDRKKDLFGRTRQ